MTRETKLGLLFGVGFILLVGIIINDHLSVARSQSPGEVNGYAEDTSESVIQNERAGGFIAQQHDETAPQPRGQVRPESDPPQRQTTEPSAERQSNHENTGSPQRRRQNGAGIDTRRVNPERETADPMYDNNGHQADVIHTVRPGENLRGIARQHYGNEDYFLAISAANADLIGANHAIEPGMQLTIPRLSNAHQASTPLAQQETAPPSQQPAAQPVLIKVESGDTLSTLAQQHLGSARRWGELLQANADQLRRPEDLRAGMRLRLPSTEPEADPDEDPLRIDEDGRTHTVRSGETLAAIARQYYGDANRWRDIFQANRQTIGDPNRLSVGTELIIP